MMIMYSNVERNRKELFVDYLILCKILVLTAVFLKIQVFWDVTSCRIVHRLVTFKNLHGITPEERHECSIANYWTISCME